VERPRYPALNEERRPAVAILGFTDSRNLAPFGDPRFEIWGINELYRFMDIEKYGFTRWFEIHERSVIDADKDHIATLGRFPLPVYMQQHYPDVTPSVPFPKAEVEEDCGTQYFTSSIAWMLGLALLEGFEEIHVYGVDMAQETEYFEQRPACEFLLGMAAGRGVKIHVPKTSDLMKTVGQYGWAGESDFRVKLDERIAWLGTQKAQHEQEIAKLDAHRAQVVVNLHNIDGAIQDCTFWKRSWSISNSVDPSKPFLDRSQDPATGIPTGDGKPIEAEAPILKLEEATVGDPT
jgi:hypothetical protein